MKNTAMQTRLGDEVLAFLQSRKSLQLATLREDGSPYASYAPFAIGAECLYVLLSEIAVHAVNLQNNPLASVLVIQDEDSAEELFARVRVNYSMRAELLTFGTECWQLGVDTLIARHGDRVRSLSELDDFKLFRLLPQGGRYVKGFGRAYSIAGQTLGGESLDHMRDGHRQRDAS